MLIWNFNLHFFVFKYYFGYKMFYITQRLIIIATFLIVFAANGSHACFQSDEYHSSTFRTGSPFYQECYCKEPGYNIKHLKWLDNNNKIITTGPGTDSNIFLERMTDSINLHIRNISKSMSGTFKCITQYKGQQYVQTYNIDAYEPLYFVNTAELQHLVEGRDVRINCEPVGETEPIIHWYRERVEFTEIHNNEKYEITPQGLIVRNVTRDDSGRYKCTALVLITGEEVDRYIKTEVMTIPTIQKVEAIPESTSVEGESLSIKCVAEGMPEPEYIWNKISNTDSNNKGNQTWQQLNNTIIFDHIKAEDEGTYECTAKNFAGNVAKSTTIKVLIPPKIHDFENITAREGEGISIVCNATGRPQPNVTVTMKKTYSNYEWEGSMEIPPKKMTLVYPSHEGLYTCNASNEVGFVKKDMFVTVLHQPHFEKYSETLWGWNEKVVNLSCVHDSNPPAIVTWKRFTDDNAIAAEKLVKGKQLIEALNKASEKYLTLTIDTNFVYGTYQCIAQNIYGKAEKRIKIKKGFAPTAVTNIIITGITATSALFTIDGPDFKFGPDIIGYTAEYDESTNYNITNIHVNRTWAIDRPFRLDKLKPNTTYYVRFAAINEVGVGAWSEMLAFNTLEKSVPESPVWDVDDDQLTVYNKRVLKWKVPEDNGDPIDFYVLRYCLDQDPFDEDLCKEEMIEPTNELALQKLETNTTYFLELFAHNAEGYSTAANITVKIPADVFKKSTMLKLGIIIGIPIVTVLLCLLLLDLLLLFWRRQGIIASCCCKKKENTNSGLQSRDKKGLLKENCESRDNTLRKTEKGHKEYEYNKTTGTITGKHSAV